MIPASLQTIDLAFEQVHDIFLTAVARSRQLQAMTRAEIAKLIGPSSRGNGKLSSATSVIDRRPLLDNSTFRVTWKSQSLHIGDTRGYWLLDRLARRPNHYVACVDLIHEVWKDDDIVFATVRSTVRNLRNTLRNGGMAGLADAIRGQRERYILTV
jgi:DNA-binding response OmpR family regulator